VDCAEPEILDWADRDAISAEAYGSQSLKWRQTGKMSSEVAADSDFFQGLSALVQIRNAVAHERFNRLME
jgi:hypothetical protein